MSTKVGWLEPISNTKQHLCKRSSAIIHYLMFCGSCLLHEPRVPSAFCPQPTRLWSVHFWTDQSIMVCFQQPKQWFTMLKCWVMHSKPIVVRSHITLFALRNHISDTIILALERFNIAHKNNKTSPKTTECWTLCVK